MKIFDILLITNLGFAAAWCIYTLIVFIGFVFN